MTSINADHGSPAPAPSATPGGLDPVHPKEAAHHHAHRAPSAAEPVTSGAPKAADLGTTAVLDHRVVAVEAGAAASPVAVHVWRADRIETILLHPVEAQVWARAGRLTLTCPNGNEHRFTVLAPSEGAQLQLGARWPVRRPEGRAARIAASAAHDIGDVLTFPAWLARSAHISGDRNRALQDLIRRIRAASPATVICFGQTFGYLHPRPDQHRPYDRRGLVGHEGYPDEL
ncbi:MAG TPA: hypothetical protein VFU73_07935 [Actinocrinis sp.]|nr:hypothetical protein [Actinocrinis sp.]